MDFPSVGLPAGLRQNAVGRVLGLQLQVAGHRHIAIVIERGHPVRRRVRGECRSASFAEALAVNLPALGDRRSATPVDGVDARPADHESGLRSRQQASVLRMRAPRMTSRGHVAY